MPISVAGIATRSGKVFVARRKPGGVLGGQWEFPGGKCEPGESPENALIREYMEELGLVVRPGRCLGHAEFRKGDVVYQLSGFDIEFDGEPCIFAEHDEIRWVNRETMERLNFVPSDRLLFRFLSID
jgi:8-oxo-dGTP diphosphatase